ncbi:MAG: hypothetical protein C0483_21575 [Pirellula sp.]|nr:hypothetical protein [Pirellula sp.]
MPCTAPAHDRQRRDLDDACETTPMIDLERAWWESAKPDQPKPTSELCAVAYYRHSAQDRQENSVAIQQEQVRQWAEENGVVIIQEFADRGKSGLTAEGRDAFNEMMEEWVRKRMDFQFILCLDVSRWGRFQDIDLSATYSAECKRFGKLVIYTTLGKPKENDQLYQVQVHFERYRAAQYSKELSDKVLRGCIKIAQQGFWAGGKPPYAFQRLLLDETRQPLHPLLAGQRKSIQNQRVTLCPGDEHQVTVVKRIFYEFVKERRLPQQIAASLNTDGVLSPGGKAWDTGKVNRVLANQLYSGTLVYNKTTQKLKTPTCRNPESKWVTKTDAFDSIVDSDVFEQAKQLLAESCRLPTTPEMLDCLRRLLEQFGEVRQGLLGKVTRSPSSGAYKKQFGSLDAAYQAVFDEDLARVRDDVESQLRLQIPDVQKYDNFLVVNRKFSVLVQPSVPVAHGYNQYWYFRPDLRTSVDITLGVAVTGHEGPQIIGYFPLPRLLVRNRSIRLYGSSDARLEMYGYTGLDVIFQLARM